MRYIIIIVFCVIIGHLYAQTDTAPQIYPLTEYIELSDPTPPIEEEWANINKTAVSWGTSNFRYAKTKVPNLNKVNKINLKGWKGENISTQAVVWSREGVKNLRFELGEFTNAKGHQIDKGAFLAAFVRYTMTDELNKDGKGSCGDRPDPTLFDSSLVADPIDHHLKAMDLKAMNTQAIWIGCALPREVPAGRYNGNVVIYGDDKILGNLELEISVLNRTLPPATEQKIHVDLWQNPFAIARYYGTPLWSEEHFEAMKPYMDMLAQAGQKVITTSIIHKPWDAQTYDYFESMITVIKKIDGSWAYDYTIFDTWVEFMEERGIDKQINCYTMIPWALSFKYYDQASNAMRSITGAPGDPEYDTFWIPLLEAFTKHLKHKGWFEKTTIAMDERPVDVMQKTIRLIRSIDPDLKISLAGNYHEEIEKDIYDYCISLSQIFPKEVLERRKKENKISTYYTSCAHSSPNYYTFSIPSEAIWLNFLLAKDEVDGYLRWAYNSWVSQPLLDSRFKSWAGGDTYFVYPGARTSIRFQKLIEGAQLFEKISILRNEFAQQGNKKGLMKIENILQPFQLDKLTDETVTTSVENALIELNKL